MPDNSNLYRTASRFRLDVLMRERKAASEMVRYFGGIWTEIDKKIKDLVTAYYADPNVSDTWLYQYDRLAVLRAQTEEQIRAFSNFADTSIRTEQLHLVDQAQRHSETLIRLGLGTPPPGANLVFNRLPVDALTDLIGFLQDGSSLRDLLNELVGETGEAVANGLVQGLALGQGPRQIARRIRKDMGNSMTRALRIARTEQLRAYRESTHRSFRANSDVLHGWIWMSARNERTCAACWALHGSKHSLDERQDEHIAGRCSQLPWVKTWAELGFDGIGESMGEIEDGVTAFGKLTEHQQLAVLGPAKYVAFREGIIKLPELVGRRRSKRWGTMRYEKSLKELDLDVSDLLRMYREISL
jgi:SPP1 gp7 family putative phage head morphogenesis protein